DQGPVDFRLRLTLPGGEKFDDLLEPAQRAGRFRQLRVARAHGRRRLKRRRGQAGEEDADFFEGIDLGRHIVRFRNAPPAGFTAIVGSVRMRASRSALGAVLSPQRTGAEAKAKATRVSMLSPNRSSARRIGVPPRRL